LRKTTQVPLLVPSLISASVFLLIEIKRALLKTEEVFLDSEVIFPARMEDGKMKRDCTVCFGSEATLVPGAEQFLLMQQWV